MEENINKKDKKEEKSKNNKDKGKKNDDNNTKGHKYANRGKKQKLIGIPKLQKETKKKNIIMKKNLLI